MARRILVAVESQENGQSLLDAAVRLAAARQAELVGFYVEEAEFLQAAALPFSKTFRVFGGGWETLDPGAMERAFRARAAELQRTFDRLCQRQRLPGRFQTARGIPGERLVEAAGEAELLILGRSRRRGRVYTGSTARRAAAESRASVLLFDPEAAPPQKVTAFYDGDDTVLVAADEMCRLFQCPLEVMAVPQNGMTPAETRRKAALWLTAHGWPARVSEAERPGSGTTSGKRTLTVVRRSEDLAGLLDRLEGPVLIVG